MTLNILFDVAVNRALLRMQKLRSFSSMLVVHVKNMENADKWCFDDIHLNDDGHPIGVTNEKGTGEDRMAVLESFQNVLGSDKAIAYFKSAKHDAKTDLLVIEVLARVKTGRCLVISHYIEQKSPSYMARLLQTVFDLRRDNEFAHVLFSRFDQLFRKAVLQAVFSDEAVEKVKQASQRINKGEQRG